MNSAWNLIKRKRKLLLCLAVLLALVFCFVLLLTSRRTPFQVFVVSTNKVRGDQTLHVVVTNTSTSAYSMKVTTEVMAHGTWEQSTPQLFEFDLRELAISKEMLHDLEKEVGFPWATGSTDFVRMRERGVRTFRFPVPTESRPWRLRLRCTRKPTGWEGRIAEWCRKSGFKYPISMYSEHTFEFGK